MSILRCPALLRNRLVRDTKFPLEVFLLAYTRRICILHVFNFKKPGAKFLMIDFIVTGEAAIACFIAAVNFRHKKWLHCVRVL